VRLSSNPGIVRDAVPPHEAAAPLTKRGGRLATFDRGIAELEPDVRQRARSVELITAH
jgi:hypothetical protein